MTGGDERGGLFDGIHARGPARGATSDAAWLQAMLDVEAALARAQAEAGLVPAAAAEEIAAACDAAEFDVADIGEAAADAGTPVVALVRALAARLPADAAAHVHAGATSQDVVDTAAMLVAARALDGIAAELDAAAEAADALAADHRDTLTVARTLGQHAVPTTFALTAAGWLAGLDAAAERLAAVRRARLAVQLGGAAGTLSAMDGAGPEVAAALARRLGLAEPALPWHTERSRVVELAGALGQAAAAAGKVGGDLARLAQTELGEVSEGGGRGGSSAMPHKRNPVAAMSAVAAAERTPGLVATLLAGAARHEHQRATGAWQAEWPTLTALLRAAGSAVAWAGEALRRVEVHPEAMRANLERTGGLLASERVAGALAPALGRVAAHDLVATLAAEATAQGRPLREALLASAAVTAQLDRSEVDAALDPAAALGSADAFVDRARDAHRRRAGGRAPTGEEAM